MRISYLTIFRQKIADYEKQTPLSGKMRKNDYTTLNVKLSE